MKWINYNHLYYFWTVAREGGVVRASEELMVSQPTISTQLRELEAEVGEKLFERAGRGLRLTEAGSVAFNYANEIFSLGQEMINALDHRAAGPSLRLSVGVLDVIPKPVAHQLLAPALNLKVPLRLVCREDKSDRLLADLAARRTELVLSDAPLGTAIQLAAFSHLLGNSGVTFFATAEMAARYQHGFPKSLSGAPMLLPTDHTQVRRSLNLWFESKRIHPVIAGEFDDSALMFWFGRSGSGVFPAPTVIEAELRREMNLQVVGRAREVRERFYAITLDKHPKHPAVLAICQGRLPLSR
ncbi:MAG TPA: transcriptional activator NhaR [Tepidisphaeraceae bacterium]|nr:transcriptional activator NhaR [Tepidisphaeraceae bacterium]